MPVRISLPLVTLAGLLATVSLAGPAAAEGPGYAEAAPRAAPRRLAHRPLPPAGLDRRYGAYAGPRVYGPVVRAYLPRNDNVPMYNEPPPR
ncbi:hypothetical protein MKK70_25605 [Methylobacterium sp. E-041]|uniref:hypothetical protein n=1 Tax=Methylobacterium sp. E-041 TaxID=2836573 RepID=UPI001FBAAE12|nr:hypothetical protein [Methylobacterium sp. E-041]MCJ2108688.1 hypothetical protein [Methylobacterium sp. E-041]